MQFIKDIGTNLYMGGFILVGRDEPIIVLRPNVEMFEDGYTPLEVNAPYGYEIPVISPDSELFKKIVRQMDIQEVELSNGEGAKMIVRKTQRAVDQRVTWEVFRRDGYRCRYCGVDGGENGATLSYDHVKLWEEGGEWSVENGVTACRKCNKQRGNTDYEEWINGDIYRRKMINLDPLTVELNRALVDKYKNFPTRVSQRRR